MTNSSESHKTEDKVQFGMYDYMKSNFLIKLFPKCFFFYLKVFKLCYFTNSTFPILLIPSV